ncbi:MAG: SRPBCC family protein [Kofleriaceae bacterium]
MTKLKILPGAPTEIIMQRELNAPRHLVIQAMTTPALIQRWLGGVRATVVIAEIDYRVGGRYRNVFRLPDGHEFSFTGVYREVSDERVVHSERFDDNPSESLVTTTLTEADGKTTLHMVIAFETPEVRDMVLGTGMADGAGESYDQLDELLAQR